jgi:hypothetical protein
MPGPKPDGDLAAPLVALRDALRATPFRLDTGSSDDARRDRDAAVHQIDDYLLPRLRSLDAPLLAVVGGSTGAGKSTLVNSLLGDEVSTAGVLRPTTRAPVLVCHPSDRRWFEDDRILPGLARVTGATPEGHEAVRLVESTGLPPGLALLDAPDIDSVVAANRALAGQLLAAADLWLFVTTAARYADAVPWDLLDEASRRSAAITVVLDRVAPEFADDVADDLRRLLTEHGLGSTRLHVVHEGPLVDGRVPEDEVAPLRAWLVDLARDAEARAAVIRTTLEGALAELDRRVTRLVAAEDEQQAAAEGLRRQVADAYAAAVDDVDEQIRTGTLLRGEVLARWQEFVGTGELMRTVQARVGTFRDRLWSAVTGRPTAADGVQEAVENGVEAILHRAGDRAAARTVAAWRRVDAGRTLVTGHERELARSSPAVRQQLPDEVRDWQRGVLDLVRVQGADKRTSARIASYTLNGAGLAVMLAVFAHTGGLTGAEVAVAGGTSAASQKLIEAVFGDQAVRTLAREARDDLLVRSRRVLAADAARFEAMVDEAEGGASPSLAEAQRAWTAARRRSPLAPVR